MLRRDLAGLALLGAPALIRPAQAQGQEKLVLTLKDGDVTIRLRPDLAPKHVERIKALAGRSFYDGTPFHRVIEGFMAQGGDPTGTGMGGKAQSGLPDLPAEFSPPSTARFLRGTCGMARGNDADTANSQFFIMFAPASFLDGKYTIWGNVTDGMDAVDKIKRGDQNNNGAVRNPDKLLRARIVAA